MQLGFVGLGAVVETAYLPALRRLYGHAVHCFGFDVLPTRQPEGVTRCAIRSAISSFVSIVSQDPSLWIKYPL